MFSLVCKLKMKWVLLLYWILLISDGESRFAGLPCTCRPVHDPKIFYTVPQLIKEMGYNVEVHTVTTPDGYILEMHRILPTKNKTEHHQNISSNTQTPEKESRILPTDNELENHQSSSSNTHTSEEESKILPTDNELEHHQNSSSNIHTLEEESRILPTDNELEHHQNSSSNIHTQEEESRKLPTDNELEHHQSLSSNTNTPEKESRILPSDNNQKHHQNISSNSHTPEKESRVPPTNNELEHHQNLSSNTHTPKKESRILPSDNKPELHQNISSNTHTPENKSRIALTDNETEHHQNIYSNTHTPEKEYSIPLSGNETEHHQNISSNTHTPEKESIGNLCKGKGGHVAFLMHGLFCSSTDFIMNDPDQALAFVMADAGWDVWMGNHRGNTYSRKHQILDPDNDSKFWDFSWDTLARFDLPAMLGYVRNHTGVSKLDYVGHSMGTRTFYTMMHFHPELNSWINLMVSLGPDAYINHIQDDAKVPIRLANLFQGTVIRATGGEILESSLTSNKCDVNNLTNHICESTVFQMVNSVRGTNNADLKYKAIIDAHNPAGSSIRSVSHYGQLLTSQGFRAYDYGRRRNLLEYGTMDPPDIDLQRVQVPVALYWGDGDFISHPEDVKRLASELPNVIVNHKVKHKGFGHMDFVWSDNATYIYYHLMRTFLNNSCSNML